MVLPPRRGLSLCAGGGGLDLGLGLAEPGFATACYVEIEDYPRQCLIAGQRAGYLHPAPIWDDIKTFRAQPWRGHIDTLLAGYPCPPFSFAGKRLGDKDPRHLWPDICRIIGELQPRWCFFENVAGHVSLGLDAVLRDLREMGYQAAAGIFSAVETGAPHERQRVFIVAYRNQPRREAIGSCGNRDRAGGKAGVCCGDMADADGGHPGPEREQCCGEQRLHPKGGGTGSGPLEDAGCSERGPLNAGRHHGNGPHTGRQKTDGRLGEPNADVGYPSGLRRRKGRTKHELWSGRDPAANDGSALADSGEPGPKGRERRGAHDERHRAATLGSTVQLRRPLLHAPGPADMDQWHAVLDLAPDLAPASSLSDVVNVANVTAQMVAAGRMEEAQAESLVCRMVASLAQRPRALRLLGNGVHPLAAGYAWRTLSAAHGLWPVDLGGTSADEGARTDEPVVSED